MKDLVYLNIGSNKIESIEGLSSLKNLIYLNVTDNFIDNIQVISHMPNLREIYLNDNKIYDIRPLLEFFEKKIDGVYWEKNPIESPPNAIIKLGEEAIIQYFLQVEKEEGRYKMLYETKLLVIGEAGSGKTTFTKKLLNANSELPKRKESTHGIDVTKWAFRAYLNESDFQEDTAFYANVWDFGGQEIYHGTHQFFFSKQSLYVLLVDTREQKTDFGYWLNTTEQLGGNQSSIFILLNKRDNHNWSIDELGLRERFGEILKETMTIDLSQSAEIPPLQERIRHWMRHLPDVGQLLIESWVKIREDLAKETDNYISFDRFREICRGYNQTDIEDVRLISGYFHRIGVFTHYMDDPALQDRIWLNSNWLCKTVYRLLEDETIAARSGRLTEREVGEVWRDNELSFETRRLVALLGRFGLMYQVEGRDEFIVPEHLPQVQPYERWPYEQDGDILYFRYRFDKYMPKGLMSGLIVALHRHIPDHDLVWNRGVNLALNGAHAEVREQYGGTNQFDIRIAGAMKRDLLVLITQAFDRMLERFAKLKLEKGIKCPCQKCKSDPDPYFHLTENIEDALIAKAHKPNPTVECKKSFDDIPIRDLLAVIDYEKVIRNVQEKTHGDRQYNHLIDVIRIGFEGVHERFDQQDVILAKLDSGEISQAQQQAILSVIEPLIQALMDKLPAKEANQAKKIETAPDLKSKLKLAIPIIPTVLSYETEFAWDWNKVKSTLRGLVL
ncbi:MAG: hypothetical protein IPN76_20735 [Saprospiraceae bacterium]|nr:hypothetical protein [Saprospiraceae bacterium]